MAVIDCIISCFKINAITTVNVVDNPNKDCIMLLSNGCITNCRRINAITTVYVLDNLI